MESRAFPFSNDEGKAFAKHRMPATRNGGEADFDKGDYKGSDEHMYHFEKNVHRLGLIYGGFGGLNVGYNSETIRDILQNKLIHQSRNPELDSWNVLNIPDQGYWNTGSTGGSSLWY